MDAIHAWGSYKEIWACPDCEYERPRTADERVVQVGSLYPVKLDDPDRECPDCGSYLAAAVDMESHVVYPVASIAELKAEEGEEAS